ncbi:hypothetical protein [Halomarina ordinaria]|uniref:YgiT-type zinc finger protein n=1 Tax=Halomarina ordinaria TaxID=3033939 RepID=A0ABD5U3J7_9EURY|nr:hypothetical protein [Halomarina sp. PSRA2]
MTGETITRCGHELDAEYLYPADAVVLELYEMSGTLRVRLAVPCPECDEAVELDTRVERTATASVEVPLDDSEDQYD